MLKELKNLTLIVCKIIIVIIIMILDYKGIEFLVPYKIIIKLKQNNISINVFAYKNKQAYRIYISKEGFENYMELFLIEK